MAILTPISWEAALDPGELKDYEHSFQDELVATSDTLMTSTFILPADAGTAGLQLASQAKTTFGGIVWFSVALASQGDAMWDGAGKVFRIRHQITTAAGRRLERSINLTVKQL